ncbi:hypothetical protein [Ammoniphilus resinae]|uniref:Uncharacterized protein n=1 Tax=Ammoniphilus resinae TaxID=861532 RepID=A0ABS4GVE7_9BACL|nr:hypothetical protein [Ammoniphilus resinae]MBP1934246.1 hypothetical protein [Ammoniphilus resinae]
MITWKLNQWGNIEIWRGEVNLQEITPEHTDLYLETEIDVDAFLKSIGYNNEKISPGEWGYAEEPSYFNSDPKEEDD